MAANGFAVLFTELSVTWCKSPRRDEMRLCDGQLGL